MRQRFLCVIRVMVTIGTGVLVGGGVAGASSYATLGSRVSEPAAFRSLANADARSFVFPLKLASSRRYLIDQRGHPFFIVGDSPQALIGNLCADEAASFIANRKACRYSTPS